MIFCRVVCLPSGEQVPVCGVDIKIWLLLNCLEESTTPKIPNRLIDRDKLQLLVHSVDYKVEGGCVTYTGEHSNKNVWVLINEGYDCE